MSVEGDASEGRPPEPSAPPRFAKAFRRLRTVMLYVLVCVVSFAAVVALFSVVEGLWMGN